MQSPQRVGFPLTQPSRTSLRAAVTPLAEVSQGRETRDEGSWPGQAAACTGLKQMWGSKKPQQMVSCCQSDRSAARSTLSQPGSVAAFPEANCSAESRASSSICRLRGALAVDNELLQVQLSAVMSRLSRCRSAAGVSCWRGRSCRQGRAGCQACVSRDTLAVDDKLLQVQAICSEVQAVPAQVGSRLLLAGLQLFLAGVRPFSKQADGRTCSRW